MSFIKRHIKALCMLLSLAVLSITIFSDNALITGTMSGVRLRPAYVVVAAVFAVLPLFLEGVTVYYTQRRLSCGLSVSRCIDGVMMSRCYGALTPMNAASHPTLMLHLKRHGVGMGEAASVSALRYVFYQSAIILLGIAALVIAGGARGNALSPGVLLGFAVNALPLFVLLSLSLHRRAGLALLDLLLTPFRRRGAALKERVIDQFYAFQTGFRALTPADIVSLSCLALLQAAFTLSIPYFSVMAVGGTLPFIGAFTDASLLTLTFTAVPLPGGTGVAEGGFLRAFSIYMDASAGVCALLIWRGVTYYLVILLGGLFALSDYVRERRGGGTPLP